MTKIYTILILGFAIISCKQEPKEKQTDNTPIEEALKFSAEDSTFSEVHYEIGVSAINALKSKDYKSFADHTVTEFLPPNGFENVDFIVTTAKFIEDKKMPNRDVVTMTIGHNDYKGKEVPFKTYTFPFFQVTDGDTLGRSSVVVTFADAIEKNKIANLSFRDY